jgi:uncharacterized protein
MTAKTILPVIVNLIFSAGLMIAGTQGKRLTISVSGNKYINRQVTYQVLLIAITGISLLTTYLISRDNFTNYFSVGKISAEGDELRVFGIVLGIQQGDSWLKTGLSLCFLVSFLTAMVTCFQIRPTSIKWGTLRSGIFWILIFSLTNSFGEEMIYRTGIVAPLKGLFAPTTIFLISAVLFGLFHFSRMPGSFVNVSMAGLLGFILAKSMVETNGYFWAWTIHFLQDLVVIGTLYLIKSDPDKA